MKAIASKKKLNKSVKSINPHESKFLAEYSRLNKRQKEAVDSIEGPVMVIAGPGRYLLGLGTRGRLFRVLSQVRCEIH